jgi:hypothetical protein
MLPDSLYLAKKPAFFGNHPWPWVDPTGTTMVHTLPARARYDAGTPVDVDLIFADGFESGDLTSWSAESTDAGDLTASPLAGMALTPTGLRAVVDDGAGVFVQDDWPLDEDRFRARFYFDPNGFDPGQVLGHLRTRIFIAFEENPARRLAAVVLRRQGAQFSIMARCRLDDNSQADTGFFPIADAPHLIEINWRRSSSPSANNGMCQLYLDGVPVSTLNNLDNSLSSVDFVRLGALSVKAGAAGVMFWDEYWSRRNTYIGP